MRVSVLEIFPILSRGWALTLQTFNNDTWKPCSDWQKTAHLLWIHRGFALNGNTNTNRKKCSLTKPNHNFKVLFHQSWVHCEDEKELPLSMASLEPRISYVTFIHIFCTTAIVQNLKITWKIASQGSECSIWIVGNNISQMSDLEGESMMMMCEKHVKVEWNLLIRCQGCSLDVRANPYTSILLMAPVCHENYYVHIFITAWNIINNTYMHC